MEYARLYWSLGALEHAMTIYDELDLFLVDIINEMCDVEAIRHFLVAQQILLSLYLYNSRHRSRGAAPSMRVDFAALVLRYAKHVLNTAMRQSRIALVRWYPRFYRQRTM
ncbi:hypothetical protein ANCDUO_20324 [Ancylostoma duodenale]|uniref:Uncharacterized protein n=1 Tax=Ancylostoma duodenale TaxID=51022 RepID=A0A0C2FXH3_9BILA|nr:hypothetical protein ANCDUO_20324 [Ancylostoma duodenale]